MDSRSGNCRSLLKFISSMLIFGTIGIFRRYIPLSSALIAFVRGILGGLFLFAFVRMKGKRAGEKLPARTFLWLAVSGAVMGANWILLFEAYNHTTVGIATLCYYMQPTIVVLLSPLLFGEKLTARKCACAAAAVIGMVLVSGVTESGGHQSGRLTGVLLGLGAAVLYATVVIMNKKAPGIEAYQKTEIQLLSAGIVMIPYLLLTGEAGGAGWPPRTVILLLVVGIVHTGLAYVLYFGSMDGLKAQSVAILSYIDPVSALLFSALLLREPLSLPGMIGAAMIIGSAVISELPGRRQRL